MRPFVCFVFCSLSIFVADAQTRPAISRDFQITKITKDFVPTPDYGIGHYGGGSNARWLQVEVEFNAAPEWTDELALKYYILVNGRLLTGDVTHVNIPAGINRSVMYVLPAALARFIGNRPFLPTTVQNVAVQIVQGGTVKDELSVAHGPAQWFTGLPPISGFVLNKNETPFAPLNWDRYAQIKTLTH